MSLTLPAVVKDYFNAENNQDIDTVAQCFAVDGVVHNNRHTHTGHAAIKAWKEASSKKYSAVITPLSADTQDRRCVVETSVSGNFPGSPLDMRFAFTLANTHIHALEISA